jgi:hypothetical protein
MMDITCKIEYIGYYSFKLWVHYDTGKITGSKGLDLGWWIIFP